VTIDAPARGSTQRRHELGAFLRSRRERLSCADVGLPATGRRRTPGLRREEVALLTGISTTWLTYLEQGRRVQASRQVLDALAATLRLTPAERAHVFDLAAEAPPPAAVPALAPAVRSVLDALDPRPAYVTAGDFEVLAWNDAAAQLFPALLTTLDGERPNVARWLFCSSAAREVFPEWESVAQDVLARLRAAAARHPDDPRCTDLVQELRTASPQARSWWTRYDVRASTAGRKRVRHPERGVLDLATAAFTVADHPDLTMVVYLEGPPTSGRTPERPGDHRGVVALAGRPGVDGGRDGATG
jgi:transcriptional regulator with XRE-family HTH domain